MGMLGMRMEFETGVFKSIEHISETPEYFRARV